ncbi:hypothetical protein TNCV_2347471 [Trichonephila clavipes]|nr:hypothetical protein TNCV_2347471 [Trichonephila clavipes]
MESLVVEPLSCHSVRLGTYKVFPPEGEESVTVYMTPESIKFYAPSARGCFQLHEIVIKHDDIISMVFHFEENAAVFIHPTAAFGDKTRQLLNIDRACNFVFNPEHEKFRFIFITFTINVLKKDHVDFIRQFYLPRNSCDFLNAKEYKELSLITAPRLTVNFVRTTATNDHPSVVWEEGTEAGLLTANITSSLLENL